MMPWHIVLAGALAVACLTFSGVTLVKVDEALGALAIGLLIADWWWLRFSEDWLCA